MRALLSVAGAAVASLMMSANPIDSISAIQTMPGSARGPIHRRGKFKPNARRQMGRKTLPRKSK